MNTVRVILSLAGNYGWELQQFYVKNVFLHGELEEEIYMEVPLGYKKNVAVNLFVSCKRHYIDWTSHLGHGLEGLLRLCQH